MLNITRKMCVGCSLPSSYIKLLAAIWVTQTMIFA